MYKGAPFISNDACKRQLTGKFLVTSEISLVSAGNSVMTTEYVISTKYM